MSTQSSHDNQAQLEQVKTLLFAEEQAKIDQLSQLLDDDAILTKKVASVISEAFLERSKMDASLGEILMPQVESAIQESVKKDTKPLVDAIFPILGPTIRRSISEAINDLIQNINDLVENSLSIKSIRWRIEAWRTGKSYAEIALLRSVDYQVQQVFLIHKETGLLLYHIQAKGTFAQDPDMVSSMLTAIQDFISDSFHVDDPHQTRSFRLGNLHLHVECGSQAILAAVVVGSPPSEFKTLLKETLEKVHTHFLTELADFEGDNDVFELSRPYLTKCLISKQKEEVSRKPKWWIIVPITVGILSAMGYWMVIEYQERTLWNRTLTTIEKAPGLVVLKTEKNQGYHITGLKDPLAISIEHLIPADDINQLQLTVEWTPYISLEEAFVLQRVKQKIAPPSSVKIELTNTSVTLSGEADKDWLATLPERLHQINIDYGIENDTTALTQTVNYPAIFNKYATAVNQFTIYFQTEEWQITREQRAKIKQFAPTIDQMISSAEALSKTVNIELTGYTDPTGTEKINRELSEKRVNTVLTALKQLKYPDELFKVQFAFNKHPKNVKTSDLNSLRKVQFKVVELPTQW